MSEYDVEQLARLEPVYQQQLGLTSAPFPPTHEDRFLYLDADRLQRLHMLQHLTDYSSLLLMVIGERGIGKTSLMDRFIKEAKPEWRICQVNANTMMDAGQLLYDIARGFGLPAPSQEHGALQEELVAQLVKLRQNNWIPLLIIDDAHELPQDALEALFHLADVESGEDSLLRIILFCEPQIQTMLEQPAIQGLRDRITHSIDIPPLTEEQTAEYLRHRLAVAGLATSSPFSMKDIHQIYRLSDGIPARINEAAHVMLSEGQTGNGESPGNATGRFRPTPTHLLLGLMALLVVTALWFQDDINRALQEPAQTALQPVEQHPDSLKPAPPAPLAFEMPTTSPTAGEASQKPRQLEQQAPARIERQQVAPAVIPLIEKPAPAVVETRPAEVPPESTPEVPPQPAPAVTEKPAAPDTTAQTTQPVPPPVPPAQILAISPATVTGSKQPQTLTLKGENFRPDDKVQVNWKDGQKILSPKQVQWQGKDEIRITLTTGTQADDWQVRIRRGAQTSAPASFRVKTARTDTAIPTRLWDSDWINRQPPRHLTLQLLASGHKGNIEKFVRQHGLANMTVAFETRRDRKPLYVLILGSYPDRAQASQAATQLPASLKNVKPWIRDFASIHKQLKTAAATPARATAITVSPLPGSSNLTDQVAWLWAQDPRHYTLQLMSGPSEAATRDFIRRHRLKGKAIYYRTVRDGQSRYNLIYGSYPDRAQARAAIQTLSPALQKTGPWARSFASIHAELPAP